VDTVLQRSTRGLRLKTHDNLLSIHRDSIQIYRMEQVTALPQESIGIRCLMMLQFLTSSFVGSKEVSSAHICCKFKHLRFSMMVRAEELMVIHVDEHVLSHGLNSQLTEHGLVRMLELDSSSNRNEDTNFFLVLLWVFSHSIQHGRCSLRMADDLDLLLVGSLSSHEV